MEPITPGVAERTEGIKTPELRTSTPGGTPVKSATAAMAKLVAEDRFVKFVTTDFI